MNHFTTPDFWYCYRHLPVEVQELADKNFALLLQNPHHPSLRLKRSARSGRRCGPALPRPVRDRAEGLVWFWIGPHSEYDQLLTR